MTEPAKPRTCPACGRGLMDFAVVDSRPSKSGQQRVRIRQCLDHPKVRAATVEMEITLEQGLRFISRIRNREKRRRHGSQDGGRVDSGGHDARS
jgi:transcriptional regulator NrdR family protein